MQIMNVSGLNSAFMSTVRRRSTQDPKVQETFPNCYKTEEEQNETQPMSSGNVLGMTMVWDRRSALTYGMKAYYASNSTKDNPIIEICSNMGGKDRIYRIPIKEIDPENATQMEMFALCSYTDDVGITDGGAFGTFEKLKIYGSNAEFNGYCIGMSGWDNFLNMKFDWKDIVNYMMREYSKAGIEKQYQEAKGIWDKLNAKDWM